MIRTRLKNNRFCWNCKNPVNDKRNKYCSVSCYNTATKTKPRSQRSCLFCGEIFNYSKTNVRTANRKFCSKTCSLKHRNKYHNPAQTELGRKKISEAAKLRSTDHLRTKEAREKLKKTITGKGHWNWQGGKTAENKRRRNLAEYAEWRTKVFERDSYTCQICGAKNGNGKTVKLNADHIKPWSLFPELRLDLNNGRTLCEPCHKETDTYMGRIKNYKQN